MYIINDEKESIDFPLYIVYFVIRFRLKPATAIVSRLLFFNCPIAIIPF